MYVTFQTPVQHRRSCLVRAARALKYVLWSQTQGMVLLNGHPLRDYHTRFPATDCAAALGRALQLKQHKQTATLAVVLALALQLAVVSPTAPCSSKLNCSCWKWA